jgi:hypothetical protein
MKVLGLAGGVVMDAEPMAVARVVRRPPGVDRDATLRLSWSGWPALGG